MKLYWNEGQAELDELARNRPDIWISMYEMAVEFNIGEDELIKILLDKGIIEQQEDYYYLSEEYGSIRGTCVRYYWTSEGKPIIRWHKKLAKTLMCLELNTSLRERVRTEMGISVRNHKLYEIMKNTFLDVKYELNYGKIRVDYYIPSAKCIVLIGDREYKNSEINQMKIKVFESQLEEEYKTRLLKKYKPQEYIKCVIINKGEELKAMSKITKVAKERIICIEDVINIEN